MIQGTPKLSFDKGPDSRLGPGDSAPFNLTATNSGTSAVVDPVIVDPLPADLTAVPGAGGVPPYTISYVLPTGYPEPATVEYTEIKGDPSNPPVPGCTDVNRVCKLSWSFPGFNLPPGGKISVQFNVELTPGVVAGATITNTAGVHGANPDLTCVGASTSGPPYGTGLYCTDPAQITTVAGNNFKAEKWIKADPALGFIDGGGNVVPVGDPSCPTYQNGGDVYTRYPCVARVLPGQQIDYLIRGINSGTNPASQIVIVDGLPVSGDNGVLLTNQLRGTEWNNRPTMLSPVTNVDGYSGVVTEYTDAPYMSGAFCRNSIKVPPNDTCPPGSFSAGFGAANTGFRTTMTFPGGDLLQPGESFTLVWSMQAPVELTSALTNPVAWNSFAYRPSFQTGQAVDVLPPTEPLKVGVAMPLTTFNVTKTVAGLPPGITLAPFELAYSCSITTASSGTVVVSSGAFTLTAGATWTSPNVPDGATCRVWETNSQGGTSANIGESNAAVLVVDSAAPNAVTITNSYTAGSLSIAKSVIWDAVPPFPVPPVQVVVNCGFPALGDTLPGYPQTFDLSDGAPPVTLTDLPVGTSCDITEANTQGATKTIIIPSNDTPTVGTSAVVGVDPADQGGTSVMIENIYQTGGLQIIKQLTGEASGWSQGPFVFDVSCVDPGSVLPPITRTVTLLPADLSTTVSPIPAGYECTVTETSAGDATGVLPPPQTVTIPYYSTVPPGPVSVTFVNDFPAGHIGVTKTVTGSGSTPMLGATFTVNIRCERTLAGGGTQQLLDESVVLSNGQTVLLPDPLPMGTQCVTTETESRGAGQVTINPTPVTITPKTPDVTVAVTNDFTAGGNGDGSIVITKVLTGAAASYALGPFIFETVCTLGGYTMPTITTRLTPTSLVGYLTGLPVGASCVVTETNNGGASGGPIPPFVVDTVTVPAAGAAPVAVTATNDFPAGSVSVSKSLSGSGAGPMAGATFTVRVTCERELIDSQGTQVILDETVTIQGGQTVTLPNVLPIGATCYAAETNSVGAGVVTISHPQGNPVQITDQTPDVSISVDNNYATGGVVLNKVITGAAASYAQGPFVFSTVCTLGGFTLPTVTSTLTPTSLTATLTGLPVGAVCVVTETNNGGASTPTVPVMVGTVTVPAQGAPAVSVTATNDFPTGSLSVTKTLSGSGSAVMAGATYTMQVTCERDLIGGGTQVIVNSTVPVVAGQTVTLPDILPIGARCWLAETNSVGAGTVTISNPANKPVVITNQTPAVTITVDNNYEAGGNRDGSIVLTKVISGAAGSYAQGPFVFQTVCTLGGFTLPVINTTLTPTSLTAVYRDLPVGASCVVTETNNGGASTPTVPYVVSTVTVPAAGAAPVAVTATNNFPPGSIAVAKTLSGAASGVMANAVFTVQVTCTRQLINGQGSETILDKSVTIKGGQTVVLPDVLPIGAQCWLVETNSVGAGTVTISNPQANPIQITNQTPNATITVDNNYKPGGTTGQGSVDGGIQVTKVITGSAAPYAQGPFTFTADCTLAKFQLPLQTLTLSPTQLVGYFGGLPVGAVCVLAETDNGSAPAPTPVSMGTVTMPEFTAPPVAATVTNDFPGAVLTVAKTVVGPGSGTFPFAVNCQTTSPLGVVQPLDLSSFGTGGAATAPAATFALASGQTWKVTVPAGATCTVQETDARGGTATYSQGGTGGSATVTLTTDQTVTATNTFPNPPVPPTSSTNSGSGLARTGGGGFYAQLIGLALLLLLGGGMAVRLTRE